MSLTIHLPSDIEQRLRNEAERQNATAESFAARLLIGQLQSMPNGEARTSDEEAAFFADAVRQARRGRQEG